MFKNVIVPLDGSDLAARALQPATALANHLGAHLKLVAYHSTKSDGLQLIKQVCDQMYELDHDLADFELETGETTRPVAELLHGVIAATSHPLVVMSTRGHGRAAGLNGSVATEVLALLDVPVMLIGPACRVGDFSIGGSAIIAADSSAHAQHALSFAAEACATLDYKPIVVNVLDPKTSDELAHARSMPDGNDLPPDSGTARRFAQDLGEMTGQPVEDFRVLHDENPGRALADVATEVGASAIIMTTHARTGFARLRHGSEAATTVTHAPCPVIAVAPNLDGSS